MIGAAVMRVAPAADLLEVPAVEAAADELFRVRGVLDLLPAASARERAGARRVTLLTHADVPWNAPWYARHGWQGTHDLGPQLRVLAEDEVELGLARYGRRVAMARPV